MKVDLAILGGGGAAFAAAAKANELGIQAVLINKGLPLGGTCVNVGCIPSKFLLELGFDRWRAGHPRFKSVSSCEAAFEFWKVILEKEGVASRNRNAKYKDVLADYRTVKLIEERAHFEGPGRIRAGDQVIEAMYVLIATGSSNRSLKIPGVEGLDSGDQLTNIEAFGLREPPKSMILLGGGPTGLEVAQMFNHFGTRVTLLEAKKRILSISEPEVSKAVARIFEGDGIEVHAGVQAKRVRKENGEIILTVETNGKEKDFRAEKLSTAIGILGNTQDLNLDAIGLQADKNGFIEVDEQMRTQVPNVFAAGDVAGPPWLETLAAREGAIAVEAALNGGRMKINYDAVPWAVFTEPQIAGVGVTEAQLMDRIGVCDCRTVELKFVPKADITNQTQGVAKMTVDPRTQKVVGFHVASPNAAEMIHEVALAIQHELKVDDLVNLVHVFPTYSEVVKITAQAYKRDIKHMSCCVE